jgi:nucleotidyltransferase substrate binding protein (TIGR01987 family)
LHYPDDEVTLIYMAVSVEEYTKAIKSLREALALPKNDIVRDATIQRFEFCVELAWKTAKKIMGTSTSAPKQVIREMAQNGYIDNVELWFDFLEDRNLSSHTYDEVLAEKVFATAQKFLAEGERLELRFKSK